MKDERTLERELLKIGLMTNKTDALGDVKLDAGTLTKFVRGKFGRPYPNLLADAAAFADDLDAALVDAEAKFYLKLGEGERRRALRRLVIWETWENKYRLEQFEDDDAGTAVTGMKNRKAMEEAAAHTFGALVNGKTNGRPITDPEKRETWWKLYAEFMAEHRNAYLLEPLRHMGLLPEPEPEKKEAA